jgi:hypothetical protein
MSIVDNYSAVLFVVILLFYLPGLIAIVRIPKLAAMPVLTFTFMGMFLFTAVGSLQVMTRIRFQYYLLPNNEWTSTAAGTIGSGEFVVMLLLQAFLFYVVVVPYIYFRRIPPYLRNNENSTDLKLRRILAISTVIILTFYYYKVGRFLLFDLLAGNINRLNILEFRAFTYGLKEYPFFRLGFLVFPALIAALSVGIASAKGSMKVSDFLWIAGCLVPSLLLAEKAAILNMAAVLFIAYIAQLGAQGRSLQSVLTWKTMLAVAAAFLPTLVTYMVYFNTPSDNFGEISDQFVFRVIGVYSEALASTVGFVQEHGYLNGTTLPNIKGLLPHDRFNLEAAMHAYIAGLSFDSHSFTSSLSGSTSVPATGEGYVNFGWPGFILFSIALFLCVIIFQELLLRLRMAATGLALSAWYGYLGFILFTTSLFATFVSLIHTIIAMAVISFWFLVRKFSRK